MDNVCDCITADRYLWLSSRNPLYFIRIPFFVENIWVRRRIFSRFYYLLLRTRPVNKFPSSGVRSPSILAVFCVLKLQCQLLVRLPTGLQRFFSKLHQLPNISLPFILASILSYICYYDLRTQQKEEFCCVREEQAVRIVVELTSLCREYNRLM